MLKINEPEVKVISKYVHDLSGIVLDVSKSYLIESRLGPIADEQNCRNYSELYFKAKSDATRKLQTQIIDAISTNETFFFRDNSPFELLKHKLIPDLIDQLMESRNGTPPSLKIWSAACSTGQEVYSIAIILKELLGSDINNWRISLIGTDISDAAIAQASYGSYNRTEISRGLKPEQVTKYFTSNGTQSRIKDEIRFMASFRKQNLLEPFTGMGKVDIILCRNVAIYFGLENKKSVFERLAKQLNPGGKLIIGSTESLLGITEIYERKQYMNSVFYTQKS